MKRERRLKHLGKGVKDKIKFCIKDLLQDRPTKFSYLIIILNDRTDQLKLSLISHK